MPAVASDGKVAFTAAPGSTAAPGIYVKSASASASPEPLYRSSNPIFPNAWSPDGRFLIFMEHHPARRTDLFVLRIGHREPIPLVVTDADEAPAVFSPDGKWIAYSSDESGSSEIYVRDFAPERLPAVGSTMKRVSPNGGDKPRWRRDGKSCTTSRRMAI